MGGCSNKFILFLPAFFYRSERLVYEQEAYEQQQEASQNINKSEQKKLPLDQGMQIRDKLD